MGYYGGYFEEWSCELGFVKMNIGCFWDVVGFR